MRSSSLSVKVSSLLHRSVETTQTLKDCKHFQNVGSNLFSLRNFSSQLKDKKWTGFSLVDFHSHLLKTKKNPSSFILNGKSFNLFHSSKKLQTEEYDREPQNLTLVDISERDQNRDQQQQYGKSRKKPNWRQRRDKVLRDYLIPEYQSSMNERNLKELREQIESHPGAHLGRISDNIKYDERPRLTCTAYCTAEAYDFNKLYLHLAKTSQSVTLTSPMNSTVAASGGVISRPFGNNRAEVFYFEGGSIICWGTTAEENEKLLSELKEFEIRPVKHPQTETMSYIYGSESGLIDSDLLCIGDPDGSGDKESTRHKLAFAYGLHNSVKLAFLEEKVANAIIRMKNIPELLVSYSWSWRRNREEVKLQLSEVLKLRAHINLYSELLETPDLFWDEPQLEYFYNVISRNLEISNRISVVNKRLDYGHELIEVLRTQLTEQHSTRLEWFIIALIAVEVVQGFVKYFI